MSLVMSQAEIDRIRASVLPSVENNERNEKRASLKKKSNDRMKNWPNTLEALRLKKESFLKDREDRDELRRQEIDKEEAELRRTLRLETIRKANDLIYEQTDKMKMMRSQQLYADVIYTRFQQMDKKERNRELDHEQEVLHHQRILEQVAEGERIEKEKIAKQQRQIEVVKLTRKEQLEKVQQKREAELKHDIDEGLAMKARAKAQLEEDLRNQERKQQIAKESNLRMLKANSDMKAVREEIRARELEAEAARDAEVEVIEHRKQALKNLEKVRFEKAQLVRQKLIDAAVHQLTLKSNTEQAILNKQEQDIKDREDKAIADKAAKLEREWNETVASRSAMLKAKEDALREQKAIDDGLVQKWRKENEDGIARETEKQRNARIEATRIKAIQYDEGQKAIRRREEEKAAEKEQAHFLSGLSGNDDSRFIELCKAEIERNVQLGKPVYTLLRALEFVAPQLLAAKTVKVVRKKPEA